MAINVAVLSGFAVALIAPLLQRLLGRRTGYVLAGLPFGLAVYFAGHLPAIGRGETLSASLAWVPMLGVNLSFYLDGWSLLFALLITGIGGLVILYASAYLAGRPDLGRFYLYILLFMASMLGVVLSDNVLGLFVFWELTSLSSYLLIGFDHERPEARAGALQALIVTSGGGLALLAGLIIMGQAGGGMELSLLRGQSAVIRGHDLYPAIVVLVAVGAFAKSAQAPLHFWLPNAMQAPRLHSGAPRFHAGRNSAVAVDSGGMRRRHGHHRCAAGRAPD